jgi:hypothetical protein
MAGKMALAAALDRQPRTRASGNHQVKGLDQKPNKTGVTAGIGMLTGMRLG